jgi:hypothetical protein
MKAEVLIRDALTEIGQQSPLQSVRAEDMATGIRYLNRLMSSKAKLGLGYTIVTSSSDEITIPTWSESWAVLLLAKALIPQYPSVSDSDKITLDQNLREAYDDMLSNQQTLPTTSYPYTLPVGSGNQGVYSERFYPADENNILQENGDNILLEN